MDNNNGSHQSPIQKFTPKMLHPIAPLREDCLYCGAKKGSENHNCPCPDCMGCITEFDDRFCKTFPDNILITYANHRQDN